MNKESLGKRYKKGNDIYQCIAYTDKPTVIMENIETNERINVIIDSMVANEFKDIEEDNIKLEHHDMFDYFSGYEYGGTDKTLLQDLETNFEIINKELKYLVDKINNKE